MRHALYIITGPDGRKYVGMTNGDVGMRWRGHVSWSYGCHGHLGGPLCIQAAIRKFGPDAFKVEHVASADNELAARQVERQLMIQHGAYRSRWGMNFYWYKHDGSAAIPTPDAPPYDVIDVRALRVAWPPTREAA